MKYTAAVTMNVLIEANSPEDALELIYDDITDFSGLEIDGDIAVGEPIEVDADA